MRLPGLPVLLLAAVAVAPTAVAQGVSPGGGVGVQSCADTIAGWQNPNTRPAMINWMAGYLTAINQLRMAGGQDVYDLSSIDSDRAFEQIYAYCRGAPGSFPVTAIGMMIKGLPQARPPRPEAGR